MLDHEHPISSGELKTKKKKKTETKKKNLLCFVQSNVYLHIMENEKINTI